MAKSVNQVILMGRLTRDAELKTTTSGKNVTQFSLAVDKGNDEAAFFDITAWDKTAELVNKYTQKGSKVLVQGRLDQQTWNDKNTNEKRSKVVVVAYDVTFLDSKNTSNTGQQDVVPDAQDLDRPVNLDDIPF